MNLSFLFIEGLRLLIQILLYKRKAALGYHLIIQEVLFFCSINYDVGVSFLWYSDQLVCVHAGFKI